MTFLISGGAKNGKSGMAQDLAVELAAGGTHYYLATMIPVDEEDRERIRRGEAVPGMNREEVIFAYGPPPSCRTPNLRNESWLYWVTPTQTVRVVFRGDIIRNIVNINKQR